MALVSPLSISVQYLLVPGGLSTFLNSLNGFPNNPAPLYLSVHSHNLVIYVAPAKRVNIINLAQLGAAVNQGNADAVSFKSFLETGNIIKVFFDARTSSKVLYEQCGILLNNKVRNNCSYIHEVQMMEVALRKYDHQRERLLSFDKCLAQDSVYRPEDFMLRTSEPGVEYDTRILFLPLLWKKYHNQLVNTRFGSGFWIAMIREATQKRLEAMRSGNSGSNLYRTDWSGFYEEYIEEQSDSWNDDVGMDVSSGGEYLGAEHWKQFDVL